LKTIHIYAVCQTIGEVGAIIGEIVATSDEQAAILSKELYGEGAYAKPARRVPFGVEDEVVPEEFRAAHGSLIELEFAGVLKGRGSEDDTIACAAKRRALKVLRKE
jgi:hypothetical protein